MSHLEINLEKIPNHYGTNAHKDDYGRNSKGKWHRRNYLLEEKAVRLIK